MKKFYEYEDLYGDDLSEIDQAGTVHFCFTKEREDGYYGQHEFVKCRDFIGDAVIGTLGNMCTPKIYGFEYDGVNNPIDRDVTRIVLRVATAKEALAIKTNALKFNNMITSAGMKRSSFKVIEDGNGRSHYNDYTFFLIEGDYRWSEHVTAMSFYTLLLRSMATNIIPSTTSFAQYLRDEDAHSNNDWSYLESFNKVFSHPAKFIKLMELLDMAPVYMSIKETGDMEYAHEQGGIQVFSQLIDGHNTGDFEQVEHLETDGTVYTWAWENEEKDPEEYQPNFYNAKRYAEKLRSM